MNNWQPFETAPHDGTRFVLWYAKERQQYIVYYENCYDPDEPFLVVDAPCSHEYRDTIEEKNLANSYWLPIDTAPRDGTHILFFYGSCNSVFTAWFEGTTWWLMSPTDFECPAYFEEENPANCYWQPMMELPV